jgi:ketosteroid isomerase-like protein
MSDAVEVFEQARAALLAADLEAFSELMADDAVFDYPFEVPGWPEKLVGKAAIREHLLATRPARRGLVEVLDIVATVHQTSDPEVVIAELVVEASTDGQRFQMPTSVNVVRVHDGKITHYRDYLDILGVARRTGRLSQLVEGLTAP